MRTSTPSNGPAGLIGGLVSLVKAVLPGFVVSLVLVFLTTELSRLGSLSAGRATGNPPVQPAGEPIQPQARSTQPMRAGFVFLLGLIPTILLGVALYGFLNAGGMTLLAVDNPSAGTVVFKKTVLRPGAIDLLVSNPGAQPVAIARADINDVILPYTISPAGPIPQMGSARVHIVFPWVAGEAYTINLFTSDSSTFTTTIDAADTSAPPTRQTLISYALLGVGAGLIPLLFGIAWAPVFGAAPKRKFLFPMALTMGLLAYSGFMVMNEALKNAQGLSGAYQGSGLVALGGLGTFLILDTVARWQAAVGRQDKEQRLKQTWLLCLGAGLRSYAQGLVIGASFSTGLALLGTLLLVVVVIQNFTEGLKWMADLQNDRPSIGRLLLMAVIGGAPAVFGIWIGVFFDWQPWTTLFFAVGGGAFLEALFEYYRRIQRSTARQPRPLVVLFGTMLGVLVLFIGGLLL